MPIHHIYVRYGDGETFQMRNDITKNNFHMIASDEKWKVVEVYIHSEEDGLNDGAPEWVREIHEDEVS